MKIIIVLFLSLVALSSIIPNDQNDSLIVTATVYHAVESQTDSSPLVTANGSIIDPQNISNWIAVSRDLEEWYPMNSYVDIQGTGDFDGVYQVMDRMHPRWECKIDILVPEHIMNKWNSIKISKVQ